MVQNCFLWRLAQVTLWGEDSVVDSRNVRGGCVRFSDISDDENRRCLVLLGKIPKKNLFTKTWGCDSPAGPVVGSASRRTQLHKRAGSLLHIYQSAMEIMIVYVADLDGAAGDDGDGDPADLLVQRRSSQWGTLSKDNLQQGHHHHKAKPACGQQGLGWDRGARIHFGVFSTSCLVPLALISDRIFLLKYNFAVFWISPPISYIHAEAFFYCFFSLFTSILSGQITTLQNFGENM